MKKHNVSTGKQTAEKIISSADLNNDGHIDFREFLHAIHPEIYSQNSKTICEKKKTKDKDKKTMKITE
eukprot:UN02135